MDKHGQPGLYGAWVIRVTDEIGEHFYKARDLSIEGITLQTEKCPPPPVGDLIDLRLLVENEDQAVSLNGEVVRHIDDEQFIVRFLALDQDQRKFLQDVISKWD